MSARPPTDPATAAPPAGRPADPLDALAGVPRGPVPAAPADPLAVLRTGRLASGYHGVYLDPRRPRRPWRAEPTTGRGPATHYPTAREAALAVAAWWRRVHGTDWREVFQPRSAAGRPPGGGPPR